MKYWRQLQQSPSLNRILSPMPRSGTLGNPRPSLFSVIPRWLLKPLVKMTTRGKDKNGSNDYASMTELAPTLHHDFQVITEMNSGLERFKEMSLDVLLLGGSISPDFLKSALDTLDGILPQAKRVEFPDLGDVAAWNYDPQRNLAEIQNQ